MSGMALKTICKFCTVLAMTNVLRHGTFLLFLYTQDLCVSAPAVQSSAQQAGYYDAKTSSCCRYASIHDRLFDATSP